jgi:hypothetical protein
LRTLARVLGWIAVVVAALLTVAGIAAWPPGGLMFALPFVFLMPAAVFWAAGLLLLRAGRRPEASATEGERSAGRED